MIRGKCASTLVQSARRAAAEATFAIVIRVEKKSRSPPKSAPPLDRTRKHTRFQFRSEHGEANECKRRKQ
jgi:hypothetical protein